jgi:hypothetical protein
MSQSPDSSDAYRVTIYYREPTYELFSGKKADPYSWTFEVEAASAQTAELEALRQFDEMARSSSVGWVRRIVRVETEAPASARALPVLEARDPRAA